jgi:hypothetical protein
MLIGWRIVVHRDEWRAWCAEHEVAARVIAIMLLAPIGVWLIGFVLVPIFMPRTILIGIPGFILLLVLVAHLERKPWLPPALMLLFGLSLILTGPVREKEDWRSVAGALQRSVRLGDVVIVCPEWKYPALRHAIARLRDVPAVTTFGERMVLMEAPVGGNRAWAQNYFRTSVEPLMRQKMKQPAAFPSRVIETRPFRRAWLVDSECGNGQRRSVQAWLGRGRWALALDRPATVQHAGIRLWRFDGEQPVARPVLTVPS